MAEDNPGGQDSETGRITSLEEQDKRIDSLSGKIDQILGIIGSNKDAVHDSSALDGPSNVAEEIRAQLDERDARKRDADDRKTASDRIGSLETRLSELSEKPPAAPVKRSTRIMWGRD